MTADEIRRRWTPGATQQEWMLIAQVEILQEMTAQLAELNATLSDPTKGINVGLCATNDTIPVMIRER